jgi:hypothetical protein
VCVCVYAFVCVSVWLSARSLEYMGMNCQITFMLNALIRVLNVCVCAVVGALLHGVHRHGP